MHTFVCCTLHGGKVILEVGEFSVPREYCIKYCRTKRRISKRKIEGKVNGVNKSVKLQ